MSTENRVRVKDYLGASGLGIALLLLTSAPLSVAQESDQQPTGDIRVQQALEELNINYRLNNNGDFRIGVNLDNGRKQIAWISSQTESFANLEIREIISPAYILEQPLPSGIANLLLEDNAQKKLGAWQVLRQQGTIFSCILCENSCYTSPRRISRLFSNCLNCRR